ncbi:MAG: RidA family protein [Planctomycetota bacterium]|nr:RidA family protein [Planctomycetota bacterium]
MSLHQVIATDGAPAPIGPYVQAVESGGTVYTSGQIALDPKTGEMVGEDAPTQARQVLENLLAVLNAAGCGPQNVLRTTIYLVDMEDFSGVNEVYAEFFGEHPPTRATVAVAGLPKGARVEIDAVACTP